MTLDIAAHGEASPLVDARDDKDSKFFCCPNGHPYPVPRCGWPMEVYRCIECKEMIGGHDHKLLSTNLRISKTDYDWLLGYWNGINRQEISAKKLPEDLLAGLRSRAIAVTRLISPDEFDLGSPPPLKLKNAIVHALPPSEAESAVLGAKNDAACNLLLPVDLPTKGQVLPSRESVEASGKRVILCFGDSLTAGLTPCGRFTPYISILGELMTSYFAEEMPNYMVLNAGVCGETTQEMCSRFRQVLREYEDLLAWVLILGGTNDLPECHELGPTAVCRTVENLKELHLMVHSYGYNVGARTVVMTVPDCMKGKGDKLPKPYGQELQEINSKLRSFAEKRPESILVDLAQAFPQDQERAALWEPSGSGSGDDVHFSSEGYRSLAALVFKELSKAAEQRGWPRSEVLPRSNGAGGETGTDCRSPPDAMLDMV